MTRLVGGCLDEAQVRAASVLAAELADALAVPPPREPGSDRSPSSRRWRGQSLSKGAAGVAVLHGVRAHAGLGPWDRVHAWLGCANREELSAGRGAGLWYGAPSLAFAISTAAPPGQYPKAMRALDTAVTMLTRARLRAATARIATAVRPAPAEFDLVRGLTGLGAHLLRRDPDSALVHQVLSYLVRLCEPLPVDDSAGISVPGWWASDVPSGQPAAAFTGGFSDQGMAHGIAGPLALLALAHHRGTTVTGQVDAMKRICQWLDAWRHDDPTGPWWPERITLAELRDGRSRQGRPARPSWCYGTPGLARAQQLAGLALGDVARIGTAEDALARCLSDPVQLARLTGPAICHGLAGVILTAWYTAAGARSPAIAGHLPSLVQALLRDHAHATHSPAWQQPGLVEGTAGVALTLHSITTPDSSRWQTCLLID